MKKQLSFLSFVTSAFLAYPAYSQPSPSDLPPRLELKNPKGPEDNRKKPPLSREEYEKCIQRRAKLEFEEGHVLKALRELERKGAEIKERQKTSEAEYMKTRGEAALDEADRKRARLNVEVLEYNKVQAEELGRSSAILKAGEVYNNDCAGRSYAIGPKAPIIVPFGSAQLPRVDAAK